MTLKTLKQVFHKELGAIYNKEEVDSLYFLVTEHCSGVSKLQFALEPEFTITAAEYNRFFDILDRLKRHEPIQYVLGQTEFYGLPFKVTKEVLIPRQETEELVDWILKDHLDKVKSDDTMLSVLDIGTGSGCIAVSLSKHMPNAKVYALDVSKSALQIVEDNAEKNQVALTTIEADIRHTEDWALKFGTLKFDCIVSNPPYVRQQEKTEIKPNVLDYEPHLALFVSDNNPLLFYKTITQFASKQLKPQGSLYVEINQYLGKQTEEVFIDAGFSEVELRKDLNGNDRMLKAKGLNNFLIDSKL